MANFLSVVAQPSVGRAANMHACSHFDLQNSRLVYILKIQD